jgi:hypothetical protein
LAVATFAAGPDVWVGKGIPTANAQSANALVANVLGLMRASPVNQAKVDAALSAAIAAGGAQIVASLVVTAGVGASGKTPNPALTQAVSNALVKVAASSDPATQAAIGAGMGKAAATLTAAGQGSLASTVTTTAAQNAGVQTGVTSQANGTTTVVLPSPQQTCSSGSCS